MLQKQFVLLTESEHTFNDLMLAVKLMNKQDDITVLVPTERPQYGDGVGPEVAHEVATETLNRGRRFMRARYYSNLHHRMKVENVLVNGEKLSNGRLKLMRAIQAAGKMGIRTNEVVKKYKLDAGTVSSGLQWLQEHTLDGSTKPLVSATEDDARVLRKAEQMATEPTQTPQVGISASV